MPIGRGKVVLGFNASKYGWTETYYSNITSNLTDLTEAGRLLAVARSQALGGGVVIESVRSTDETNPGPSDFKAINYRAVFFTAQTPTDQPYSCILTRLETADSRRRMFSVSGCPDDVIVSPPGPTLTNNGNFQGAFNAFLSTLTGGSWCIKALQLAPGNPKVQVTSYVGAPPATLIAAGLTLGTDKRIILTRFKPKAINGRWTVITSAGTVYTLKAPAPPDTATVDGFAQVERFSLLKITKTTIVGENSHRRGRALKSPRGRRRK